MMFLGGALAAGLGAAAWLNSPSQSAIPGVLAAHAQQAVAPISGTLAEMRVTEGAEIEPDQSLAIIVDADLEAARKAQRQIVDTLAAELDKAKAQAALELKWRTQTLNADVMEVKLRAATLLRERFSHEIRDEAWGDYLEVGQAISSADTTDPVAKSIVIESRIPNDRRIKAAIEQETARNAAEAYTAQIELCDERLEELANLQRGLPAEINRAAGVDIAEQKLRAARTELSRLEARAPSAEVMSPGYGDVGVFQKREGDRVAAGDPIVEVLDPSRRYVIAYVPSRRLTTFVVGATVELIFSGDQQRAGIVKQVPPQTSSHDEGWSKRVESTVPVRIEQAGQQWPDLPIGSTVQVQERN